MIIFEKIMFMENIAVFASGNGTNAENICNYFSGSKKVRVSLICTNKKDAPVLKKTKRFRVDQLVFSKKEMDEGGVLESVLREKNIHFIVLAGFLLKVPRKIISLFNKKRAPLLTRVCHKHGLADTSCFTVRWLLPGAERLRSDAVTPCWVLPVEILIVKTL